MAGIWVAVLLIATVGCVAVVFMMRRVHDEISPTIRAFAELRGALAPVVSTVHADTDRLNARLATRDAAREPGRQVPRG